MGQRAQDSECATDDDDTSSCTSFGASADEHIERAEILPIRQCSSLLTALVRFAMLNRPLHFMLYPGRYQFCEYSSTERAVANTSARDSLLALPTFVPISDFVWPEQVVIMQLNNPAVQQSVHQALQQDPNFTKFIQDVQVSFAPTLQVY